MKKYRLTDRQINVQDYTRDVNVNGKLFERVTLVNVVKCPVYASHQCWAFLLRGLFTGTGSSWLMRFFRFYFLKTLENRLGFDRIVVMSLWPRFFGPPCSSVTA